MIIVCQSLGSRQILVQELFTLVPHLFGTTSCCLSIQPFQLLPLRNIWRHISLTWPFPHRYRHARWPVDVTELFPRFCCWTLIWLSRHWAWLRWGYWRYRNLTDWLIDWFLNASFYNINIKVTLNPRKGLLGSTFWNLDTLDSSLYQQDISVYEPCMVPGHSHNRCSPWCNSLQHPSSKPQREPWSLCFSRP